MKSIMYNSLLLILSINFALFTAELAVSRAKPQNLSGRWRETTMNGLFVNKSHGSFRHQFGDRVVTYQFSSPHLRGPVHNGSVKVLVLGDSYTFGLLLDDQHHYVSLLQQKVDSAFGLETIALLNAAVGGWGTGDQVAYVEDFGGEIRPDFILVFLNIDDIGRAQRSPLWTFETTSRGLTRRVAPENKLKRFMAVVPGYPWLLEHSHLTQLVRTTFLSSGSTPRPADRAAESPLPGPMDIGASLFSRLQAWCEKHNVYLAVTTTGWHRPPYTLSERTGPYRTEAATEAFMIGANELFAKLGVPFSDPSAQLWRRRQDAAPNTFVIPNDFHPNEAGAALTAELVFPFLSSQLKRYCHPTNRCVGPR